MSGVSNIANLLKGAEKHNIGNSERIHEIELDLIEFDPEQPRQDIKNEEIEVIANTLKPKGSIINQPITVWKKNKLGKYVVKFGEKRTRASILAGRKTIRAIIDERYDFDNQEHRIINFAEQYVENFARGDLTPLDDCLALKKLKKQLGTLKEVQAALGIKSLGTISDKIKVASICDDEKLMFLLDFYRNDDLKFKDLTMLKGIIDIFSKNPLYYEKIKLRIIDAAKKGLVNRKWVEKLSRFNWDEPEVVKEQKEEELNYKIRPIKKIKVFGTVLLSGNRVSCELLVDRVDVEDGYTWVKVDGEDEPTRVKLSDLFLTKVY